LLKLNYSANITGDQAERKEVSTAPKSVYCSYNANFILMVIKHTKETNKRAAACKFHVMGQNV
jgi:predicted double-glycine peptidase